MDGSTIDVVVVTRPRERRLSWIVGWAGVALLSLWLRTGFPVHAIAGSDADDGLFIRLARSLQAGDWLGSYDNLTLAKGMFYPLFIAVTSLLAIPLRIAEHGTYLLACALAAGFVQRRSGRPRLGLLLFAAMALSPVLWSPFLARVVRENLYVSLSLALLVLTVIASFPSEVRSTGRGVRLGLALGGIAAAFWLTREEGIWMLPALGVAVLCAAAGLAWRYRSAAALRRAAWPAALPLLVAGAVFAAGLAAVSGLNLHRYGVFGTNEFKSAAFERGYGALSRIRPAEWRRLVVFPRDARERAYAVSPAARELAPFFEGPGGEGWRGVGCTQTHIPRAECPEILAGWFMWALRDAVSAAGYGHSAVAARNFYRRLTGEIDAACEDGRLDCLPSRATLAPPFQPHYVLDALAPAGRLLRMLFAFGDRPVGAEPSVGPRSGIAVFADAVGPVFSPEAPLRRLQGWVAATAGAPEVSLRGENGQLVVATVTHVPAPDVQRDYPDRQVLRFVVESTCPPGRCELVVAVANGSPVALPWSGLQAGLVLDTAALRVFADEVSEVRTDEMSARRQRAQLGVARVIAAGYAAVFPVLGVLGAAGLLLAAVRWRRRPVPPALLALALASGAAVASRVALLAYLDVTSIPSANMLYVSPAAPFVVVFSVLGVWLGLGALRRGRPGT